MSKCKYLIDISPYDPLCNHPCRLYGGGAVEAECETCQYCIEDLERENAKLRELVRWMYDRMDESCAVQHAYAPAPISYDLLMQALARVRNLGVEVNE